MRSALGKVAGVDKSSVNFKQKEATVTTKDDVEVGVLLDALKKAGFKGTVKEDKS